MPISVPLQLGPKVNVCPSQVLSSDPDDEEEAGGAAAAVGAGDPSRVDRDKEWAALTTWLRMNLHHPRTVKREVLFLGKHVEGRWVSLACCRVSLDPYVLPFTLQVDHTVCPLCKMPHDKA